ncbi:MAG: hypothetical protein LRY71_06570 [Bacillaceae bacterium]|nr:hypothetical protein [Bacillaceae bacterium]
MQIFISPELIKEDAQVLNIVTEDNKPVGFLTYIIEETKMYIYGHLEEEGVAENYKDIVKPYLQGLQKLKQDLEVLMYLSVGGKKIDISIEEENS